MNDIDNTGLKFHAISFADDTNLTKIASFKRKLGCASAMLLL